MFSWLYVDITKLRFSELTVFVPSIFVILLVNGAQFLNNSCVVTATVTVMLPFTET